MGDGLNWGAAFSNLGSGISQMAEYKARLAEDEKQRQQQLDDLEAQRAYQAQLLDAQYARADAREGGIVPPPTAAFDMPVGPFIQGAMPRQPSVGVPFPAQDTFDYAGQTLPRAGFAGMTRAKAFDDYMQANPVHKQALPDPTTLVTVVDRGGSRVTIPVAAREVDTLVASGKFSFGGQGQDGSLTLVERAEPEKNTSDLPERREARAARGELEKMAEGIIDSRWGSIGGNARRLPTGELVPGAYVPGSTFDVGSFGQVGEELRNRMAGTFREATIGSGRMPSYSLADSIQGAIQPQYDMETIPQLNDALDMARAGYEFDPEVGKFVKHTEGPVPLLRNIGAKDEKKLWNDFLREVGAEFVGTKRGDPKWNTVQAWLRKNGATIEQLNFSAGAEDNRASMGIPSPSVSAPSGALRKTLNGVSYINKTGDPQDWDIE